MVGVGKVVEEIRGLDPGNADLVELVGLSEYARVRKTNKLTWKRHGQAAVI